MGAFRGVIACGLAVVLLGGAVGGLQVVGTLNGAAGWVGMAVASTAAAVTTEPPEAPPPRAVAVAMEWIAVGQDGRSFVHRASGRRFYPWGFNYDHDEQGRLLEDYWETEWPKVEADFAEMKELGANCVRVHLQFGKFMDGPDRPRPAALRRLRQLLELAERHRLYLDLTGLGCYHKQDVPAWYDALDEAGRWAAQAAFWKAVAQTCRDSPAVWCYDLMNEPVVPGGQRKAGDWLGPPFGGKHFVQVITLDQRGRERPAIAQAWLRQLVRAIRGVDDRHLITVGLVDWSLDRPGLTSGFVPQAVAPELDFLAVHIYPVSKKLNEALETVRGFAVGKPVVIEECFPLRCSPAELDEFVGMAEKEVAGWCFFYWGRTVSELEKEKTLGAAMQREWLKRFAQRAGRYQGVGGP